MGDYLIIACAPKSECKASRKYLDELDTHDDEDTIVLCCSECGFSHSDVAAAAKKAGVSMKYVSYYLDYN
jgi:tripartite-type tricarboxylate transporter receptor subunit TctC